ncbi:MAG: DUF2169 domain-containing protein [Polyangiaceae bacterium]
MPLVDVASRPVIVAVMKATFTEDAAGRWMLADDPSPVRWNDVMWFPDALDSSIRYPSDAVPQKVGTDILFVGEAVSTRSVPYVDVAVQARSLRKTVRVHGERLFYKRGGAYTVGPAAPFQRRPIVYELSYGGTSSDGKAVERRNPVGRGVTTAPADLDGKPAPCIEDPRSPVTSSADRPAPWGLGALGSHWLPRVAHAGTFDETWRKERMPLLPADFSPRYYNAAPLDQTLDPPIAVGEDIAVLGMREEGVLRFTLPSLPIVVFGKRADGTTLTVRPHVDTVLVEPGRARVEVTLRAALPKGRGASTLREIRIHEEEGRG